MTSLGKGTADQSHRDTGGSGGIAVLFRSQGGLPEVMLLKQSPAGSQQASPVDNGERAFHTVRIASANALRQGGVWLL